MRIESIGFIEAQSAETEMSVVRRLVVSRRTDLKSTSRPGIFAALFGLRDDSRFAISLIDSSGLNGIGIGTHATKGSIAG